MTLPTDTKPAPAQSGGSWKIATFLILAVTILGSIPTVIHVFYLVTLGVNWGEVPFARQQRTLWDRNWMCASGPGAEARLSAQTDGATAARQIETLTGLRLRVQACANGDVLARTVTADGAGRAIWIASEGFETEDAALAGGMRALAQEAQGASGRQSANDSAFAVMCQAWGRGGADSGRVVRIVSLPDGCTREEIDIFTGKVVRVETVPCSAECAPSE